MKKKAKVDLKKKKREIIDDYAELANQLDRTVHMNDLADAGHTKDSITHHFRNLNRLDEASRATHPNKFHDVSVNSLIGPKALTRLQGAVANHKKFIIVDAITECKVHDGFYNSIKTFCSVENAALLVLVQSDPTNNHQSGRNLGFIDRKLQSEYIVVADTALNNNLYVSTIKLSAKQKDPVTGLGRIGQRNGSFIYASPKQRLKVTPVSNDKLPHLMMTTGAITVPSYGVFSYMAERSAYIAEHDHVMGALVVEVLDDEHFQVRQVQADERGHFIDIGKEYRPNCVMDVQPAAFVLGDWHSGETDWTVACAWFDLIKTLNPKRVVLHDVFNGMSINHHDEDKAILRAQRSAKNELNLDDEIVQVASDLTRFAKLVDEVVVVRSNHDEFLERYLQFGKYVADPLNHRLSLRLALAMLDGQDPLKFAVEEYLDPSYRSKINWLTRDQDYKIARIQLGAHGDKGANGAKGSLPTMEAAYGNSITGHSHSPEILRGAWAVGTSSKLKLSYNVGPSSWMHSSILLYENGSRQMIHCIDGKWKA